MRGHGQSLIWHCARAEIALGADCKALKVATDLSISFYWRLSRKRTPMRICATALVHARVTDELFCRSDKAHFWCAHIFKSNMAINVISHKLRSYTMVCAACSRSCVLHTITKIVGGDGSRRERRAQTHKKPSGNARMCTAFSFLC